MMTDDSPSHLTGAVNPPSPIGYGAPRPPLPLPALKHRFDAHVWIPSGQSRSGYPQTERTCTTCGAVKVTIHGAHIGRAWRASEDAEQIETFEAPVCVPKVAT